MCTTITNVHKCGHKAHVDVERCCWYRSSLEAIDRMHSPEYLTYSARANLKARLEIFRGTCVGQSKGIETQRDYECEACLSRALGKVGLGVDRENKKQWSKY
jgi:hypothetical protein